MPNPALTSEYLEKQFGSIYMNTNNQSTLALSLS
jgi:hypothetical protein